MREIKKAQIIQILNEAQHEFLEDTNRRTRIINKPIKNPETGEFVINPETGQIETEPVSHMSFDPHRTYMPVPGDKGNQTLQNTLIELGKAKDGNEAKLMLYKMRWRVRKGDDPAQILKDYGIPQTDLFIETLTVPEEPKIVQPMTDKEFALSGKTPQATKFIYSGTGQRKDRFLHQPFSCKDLEEWKRNNAEEYEKQKRIFGPSIGFCYHKHGIKKIETSGGYWFEGYSHGTPIWKKLMKKGYSEDDAKNYVIDLRILIKNNGYGYRDVQQLLRDRDLLGANEQLPDMEYKEVSGGHESDRSSRIKTLATKINEDLMDKLRDYFVEAPHDNQDISIAEFKTNAARKIAYMLNSRSIPPILINTKFTDRNQVGSLQSNTSIGIKGISQNFYPTSLAFIESVISNAEPGNEKKLSTLHQARWANLIGKKWEEERPGVKQFLGKSDRYRLHKLGYRPEQINIMLKTDWSINGQREGDNFKWTFKFIVKFGAKQEEEESFLYGLKIVKFKEGDDGKFMSVTHDENAPMYRGFEKTVEVPLDPNIEYNDDNPITKNKSVMKGLDECIKQMISEIGTIDRFGAITLSDIPAQVDESYRITQRVIKEIKNNYYKPKAY